MKIIDGHQEVVNNFNLLIFIYFSVDEVVSEVSFQWAHRLNRIAYVPQVTGIIVTSVCGTLFYIYNSANCMGQITPWLNFP